MKKYELATLVSSEFSDKEIGKIQEEIELAITENKGIVLDKKLDPVKRSLGYSIGKINNAYLASFYFNASPSDILDINKNLKENKRILRYVLVCKEKERREKKRKLINLQTEKKQPEKTDLKEIDKKIEEILNQ